MRVTFIGLGAMGEPMARHVAGRPGLDLTAYDISPAARNAATDFARVASSVAEAVSEANVVLSMLPADRHVVEVASSLAQSAPSDAVYVDLSTILPGTMNDLRDALSPRLRVVSATCMKSVAAARAADLTVFVGGDPADIAYVRPILDAMASSVFVVGDGGQAKALKLINNQMVASLNLVLAEAAVIVGKWGIPYEALADRLLEDGVGGWALQNHFIKHTLSDDLGAGYFSTSYMSKDITLASQMALDMGGPRFMAGLLLAAYRGAAAIGYGNGFHPVVIRWMEHIAEPSIPSARALSGSSDVLADISAWVGVAEHLIALHGIGLAGRVGIPKSQAATWLAGASADSGTLRRAAAGDFDELSNRPSQDAAALSISRGLALAADADVPGLTLECARGFLASFNLAS